MTLPAQDIVERREWLIRKDGYFYRPNCQGYTTRKIEAGRYREAMMRRLGKRQIELLAGLARYGCAMVVGDRQTCRLEELGLLKHHGKDGRSFAAITPKGLRLVADAVEDGRICWFSLPAASRPLPLQETEK